MQTKSIRKKNTYLRYMLIFLLMVLGLTSVYAQVSTSSQRQINYKMYGSPMDQETKNNEFVQGELKANTGGEIVAFNFKGIPLFIPVEEGELDLGVYGVRLTASANMTPFTPHSPVLEDFKDRNCVPIIEDLNNNGKTDIVMFNTKSVLGLWEYNIQDQTLIQKDTQSAPTGNSFGSCPVVWTNGTQKYIITNLKDSYGWSVMSVTPQSTLQVEYTDTTPTANRCADYGQIVCVNDTISNGNAVCYSTSVVSGTCDSFTPENQGVRMNRLNLYNFTTEYALDTFTGSVLYNKKLLRRRNSTVFELDFFIQNAGQGKLKRWDTTNVSNEICTADFENPTNNAGNQAGLIYLDNSPTTGSGDIVFVYGEGSGLAPSELKIFTYDDDCNKITNGIFFDNFAEFSDPFISPACIASTGHSVGVLTRTFDDNIGLGISEDEMFLHCYDPFSGEITPFSLGIVEKDHSTSEGEPDSRLYRNIFTGTSLVAGDSSVDYYFTGAGIFRIDPDNLDQTLLLAGLQDFGTYEGNPLMENGTLKNASHIHPIDMNKDGVLDLITEFATGEVTFYISAGVENALPNITGLRQPQGQWCEGLNYTSFVSATDLELNNINYDIRCGNGQNYIDTGLLSTAFPEVELDFSCTYDSPGFYQQIYSVSDDFNDENQSISITIQVVPQNESCTLPQQITPVDITDQTQGALLLHEDTGAFSVIRNSGGELLESFLGQSGKEIGWLLISLVISGAVLTLGLTAFHAVLALGVLMIFLFMGTSLGFLSPFWGLSILLVMVVGASTAMFRRGG